MHHDNVVVYRSEGERIVDQAVTEWYRCMA